MPYVTDERLKSYLDTNQLHREQMCLAVLALDKRFTEVRPRHPRGGPDGGRDIEAIFRGGQQAFGAVGFTNQADDSEPKKAAIRRKFLDDLDAALQATPAPLVFVFFTNVNFTVSEKDNLIASAREKGLVHCEIFDRERVRIALDSADGFAIRFQYLGIVLTEEEQASFFAKWGDDINSVISTGFQKVQRTLDHLLFLQEASDPIGSFNVALELDKEYPAEEIGHFRAFCHVWLKEPKLKIFSVIFGSSDQADRFSTDAPPERRKSHPGIKFGISGAQWEQYIDAPEFSHGNDEESGTSREKLLKVGSSSGVGQDKVKFISANYQKDSFMRFRPVLSLRDFDDCIVLPMLNLSLARKVKSIHIISNGYKLLEVSTENFIVDETPFSPVIPIDFEATELLDPWIRIRPIRASCFRLSFSEVIPRRLFVSQQAKNTLPMRLSSE